MSSTKFAKIYVRLGAVLIFVSATFSGYSTVVAADLCWDVRVKRHVPCGWNPPTRGSAPSGPSTPSAPSQEEIERQREAEQFEREEAERRRKEEQRRAREVAERERRRLEEEARKRQEFLKKKTEALDSLKGIDYDGSAVTPRRKPVESKSGTATFGTQPNPDGSLGLKSLPPAQSPPAEVVDPNKAQSTKAHDSRRVPIAAAGKVRGEVMVRQPDGSWKQIQSGTAVNLHDFVKTGPDGRMQVQLLEGKVFIIGPNTELRFDEFDNVLSSARNSFSASLTKGIIRFVSDKIAQRHPYLKITSRVVTGGVRGSDFVAKHDAVANVTTFYLHEGNFDITPVKTGKTRHFSAGHIVVVDQTGIIKVMPLSAQTWEMVVKE